MTKYSVRLILWEHDKNASNKYPIYIRITVNGRTKYIASGIFVVKGNWDSKNELIRNHASSDIWNADLASRKQTLIQAIVERQVKGVETTAAEVKDIFSKNSNNFFDFASSFINEVRHKRRANTLENYRKHLLKLELYHGSRILMFDQLTHDYLVKYEEYLRSHVGENYIHALWKTLKTFFNAARKRGVTTAYPFANYENPKYTAPEKDYLTMPEIKEIEKLADRTKDPTIRQTAVYFLFGCYSGLRLSDWRQFSMTKHVHGDEIVLRAIKNKEPIAIPIHTRLRRNLARMRATELTMEEPVINRTLKEIAGLIGSGKRITTHTGRHTFAVTMCLNRGISSEVVAELMGITLKTFVGNYSQITRSKMMEEARRAWKTL
jgi:integrase/recombinase XerD